MLEETLIHTKNWQIGLSDQGHEGRWIWQHSVSDVEYESWAWGQPDGSNAGDDCACMDQDNGYMWVAVGCDEGGEVGSPICMRDAPDSSSTSPPWPSSSPWYWTVELHGGLGPKEGNVYANNRNGDFGPVCDHGWTDVEATVVCRQLGYLGGGKAVSGSYFDPVSSEHSMNEVNCRGSETYLQECSYSVPAYCASDEGAGVTCYES